MISICTRLSSYIVASGVALMLWALSHTELRFLVSPSFAATPDKQTESSIMAQLVAPIRPVAGADGRTHLVYELLLVNQSAFSITINSIAVLDGKSEAVLKKIDGGNLSANLRISLFGDKGTTLLPSQSALVFIDSAIPKEMPLPASVQHRIETTQVTPAAEDNANLGGLTVKRDAGFATKTTFITSPMPVDADQAVVLSPPVRGNNWIIFRGCCDVSTSHRGTTASYNGVIYMAERFAIDFARIADDSRLITGPGNELSSYVHFGAAVHAVADGTVISARNNEPDQVPGKLPEGITAEMAGGNAVLLDIGNNRFAFYAHMQPGSVRVKAGDRVKSGEIIGAIGNSGKTFGPHLHFHVVDRASPIAADGVPFVFSSFTGQGVLSGQALVLAFQGKPAPIERGMLAGPHADQQPLSNQIVDFTE